MRICVAGLGKIGVPLAVQYASKGHDVAGYDISQRRVDEINAKHNPLPGEPGLDEKLPGLVVSGKLRATTDAREAVAGAEAVVLIVPVDIDVAQRPDFTLLDAAVDAIAPHLRRGALVIVETTVPVGTTRHRVGGRIARATGYAAPADVALAFSPERVSSGTVLRDLRIYPKVVGGVDARSTALAVRFYGETLDAEIMEVRDAETAEYSKLLETTYRDVNIALANEFARVGDALGVDTLQAIAAANSQPYSHIHAPGPGVGGHCIPVYPYFIGAPEAPVEVEVAPELTAAARRINDAMAHYAVSRLSAAMGGLDGATVVVLGLAYRAGVKEWRHSSAFGLYNALVAAGATAYVHDPLFAREEIEALGLEAPPSWPLPCDALVVQAWHGEYGGLDLRAFAGLKAVLDARAALEPAAVEGLGVRYVGIGR
ncbi:MAG TPA: nucleotide sugar dehydrogenase [Dehalococcoidia bacterium]|nr:nucleotide sugar dehydrogenase [Dehalococcoidia bacterium]